MAYTKLRAGMILSGPIGDRPPASVGEYWYFADDEGDIGILYHSDGATWTAITEAAGSSFDLPGTIHGASSKATPVDADELALADSAASFALKKLTWANLKATAKSYFDTLYDATGAAAAAQAASQPLDSDLTAIAALSTSSFGRGLLTEASAASARSTLGINETPWSVVTKSLDETVAGSTTLQDDDELFFTASAGVTYEILLLIVYVSASGGATPDLKIALGEDNTKRGVLYSPSHTSNDNAQIGPLFSDLTSLLVCGTATINRFALIFGGHVGAGGTFKLQWAQNTSSGSPNGTTIKAGSKLLYRVVV